MKRLLSFALSLATLLPALPVAAATLVPGDLIKASGQTVYYYGQDGKRYVFPTEKTYKSWFADFNGVKTVTDAELATVTIGGNVTYRPGVRLVKITTDPKVYAIEGKQLRWIMTEALAIQLFGANWATQVDDIPDAFFVNYTVGAQIDEASDYPPTTVREAYQTIQAVLSAMPTTPDLPAPIPTPSPTPTSTTSLVTLTPDKTTAQANEQVFLLAETSYTGSIAQLTLFVEDQIITSCPAKSCSGTWVVPGSGVKSSYTLRAVLTSSGGMTFETKMTLPIVTEPLHASIQISADRTVIKPGQIPHIRSLINAGLSASVNEIYVDGAAVKACSVSPSDCRYDDYLTGDIGTTHQVYAIVTTPNSLKYKSHTITITIATNDTPIITLTSGLSEIRVGESVEITNTAQDDDGIAQTQILKDGQVLKTCAGAVPCTVQTGPWMSAGTLTFQGTASDLVGATSTAMTTVVVK